MKKVIIGFLVAGFLIGGCSGGGTKTDEIPDLPQVVVLPFFTRGPQIPDMMDITETMIFFLKNEGKYLPRDAGESLSIVKAYDLRGIYPGEDLIRKIGVERKADFILIGKVEAEPGPANAMSISSMDPETVDIKVRLINARTGKLKQVFFRQTEVEGSVSRTINETLAEIAEKM